MSVIPSKQGFRKNPDGSYSVTDKRAEYGKITGTQISGLLGCNPWQTQFSTAVKMMRLYSEDISDKPAIHAGTVIEPKILDYAGALHGEDVFQSDKSGDHESWTSDFKDDFFGGHIDGLMSDGAVVEVKTSSRPQDWDGRIPTHYWMQASLYAHFLKTDKIVFLVGFTDRDTWSNPDKWEPNGDNTIRVDTGIIPGFEEMMEHAKDIYCSTVLQGITPIPDPTSDIDARIVEYLDAQLWDEGDAAECVDTISRLNQYIAEINSNKIELDNEKELLDLYMRYNNLSHVETDRAEIDRTTVSRTTIDTNQLKKDGVYEVYAKQKEYTNLKVRLKK